jgi:hypothetical protein
MIFSRFCFGSVAPPLSQTPAFYYTGGGEYVASLTSCFVWQGEPSMQVTRQDHERHEDAFLAPYAMRSHLSRGRVYPEDEHPYRTAYQRDRDRIIHTTAFRRLEYKTQVFV